MNPIPTYPTVKIHSPSPIPDYQNPSEPGASLSQRQELKIIWMRLIWEHRLSPQKLVIIIHALILISFLNTVSADIINFEDIINDRSNVMQIMSFYNGRNDKHLQNFEALRMLKEEQKICLEASTVGAILTVGTSAVLPLPFGTISIPIYALTKFCLDRVAKIDTICMVMEMLLEHFGDEGIKITPRVNTDTAIIDLFLKMPDKRSIALMLRSNGECLVRWREDRKQFVATRKGKGARAWSSPTNAIEQLKSVAYLSKQKSPILGATNTERKKFITKAIVLLGGTQFDCNSTPELLTDFGRAKVLTICDNSLTHLVQKDHLIDFLFLPEAI